MRYDFAPMEGLTSHIHRRLHAKYFPGVDRYYMPFLSPTMHHGFTSRELADILPEHNQGFAAVPQILTKSAEDFLWAAGELAAMGYEEVNLNLGCPSGTVTAKGKGAGFLRHPEELERFLDTVFSAAPVQISVKTRLGMDGPEEFWRILEIFNRYPICELTIHPRVQKDMYRGPVRMAAFRQALAESKNPVCYNGNLTTQGECRAFLEEYPQVGAVMLGRGLIADPALAGKCKGLPGADKVRLRAFHDGLLEEYRCAFGSMRNAMFRMKEVWAYQRHLFADSEKHWKKLRKTTDFGEYCRIVDGFFSDLELLPDTAADW